MKVVGKSDAISVGCPSGAFTSHRYVLAKDSMGFGIHKTVIPKGGPHRWHYKHHLEACFCVSGRGILTDETTGDRHAIQPDSCYVLDNHDPHTFEALTEVVLISVFNPPCNAREVHRADGSYPESD